MFKSLTAATAAVGLLSAPALAGSADDLALNPDPVVVAPGPQPSSSPDWTGFYTGAQIGYANGDTNFGSDDDEVIGGITAGYDYDFGQWVLGAGIDYDFTDIEMSGLNDSLDQIFRLKVRAGYKLGQGLLYGTGGYANADSDNFGNEDGFFVGGGYEYWVNENFSVATEVLYHEFNNFDNTPVDVEVTTVQLRATFRF